MTRTANVAGGFLPAASAGATWRDTCGPATPRQRRTHSHAGGRYLYPIPARWRALDSQRGAEGAAATRAGGRRIDPSASTRPNIVGDGASVDRTGLSAGARPSIVRIAHTCPSWWHHTIEHTPHLSIEHTPHLSIVVAPHLSIIITITITIIIMNDIYQSTITPTLDTWDPALETTPNTYAVVPICI